MATGVLPLCMGEGTKVLPFLLDADKEYEAILRLGVVTDTLDAMGKILTQQPVIGIEEDRIRAVMGEFLGTISQVPPMYSALKRDGRPLYAYAREGKWLERAERKVTITALELQAFGPPDLVSFRVRCSKGTYVRQLAADLGERLGVGGHLVSLRRTVSGPFHLGHAHTPSDIEALVEAARPLPFLSLLDALQSLPHIIVDEAQRLALMRGQTQGFMKLWTQSLPMGPVCAIFGQPSELVAVIESDGDGTVQIRRGFQPQRSLAK
jgi:tRNA pseudouridine55 synthase